MRVLVCGDRHWSARQPVEETVRSFPKGTVVIHGGAKGADTLAGRAAQAAGLEVVVFKAEWHRVGRAAGPIRNARMLQEGKPDLVIAFHSDLERSKGTRDMVTRARKAGVPVRVVAACVESLPVLHPYRCAASYAKVPVSARLGATRAQVR